MLLQKMQYEQQMIRNGYLQGKKSQREALKGYVNKRLFTGVVKFITCEKQMEEKGDLAARIMNDLDVNESQREWYWDTHKAFITKTLRTKRNNICMTLKEAYLSMYIFWDIGNT